MSKHWAASLIGKPYRAGSSGPDGFDCVGLVRYYFKERHGLQLPDYHVHEAAVGLAGFVKATGWRRHFDAPQDEDVLLMRSLQGRHVGVVVRTPDGLGLLHAEGNDRSGSVRWQPLDTLALYTEKEVWRPPCTI